MDDRTAEAISSLKARLLTAKRTKAETLGVPPYVLQQAADTIERLQKELVGVQIGAALANEQAEGDRAAVMPMLNKLRKIADERDAALAEVERLKGDLRASRENEAMA